MLSPFVDYEEIHVKEGASHEEQLRNSQSEQVQPLLLPKIVEQFEEKTEKHMDYAQYDCHFHLETIGKGHLIIGHLPHRVHSERIHAVRLPLTSVFPIPTLRNRVTTGKKPQIHPKELIVEQAAVAHPKNHCPEPQISLEVQQQRYGHEHVPHVSKHHSNEEPKRHYVEGGRIDLPVGRDAVGIDDCLRDLQHDIGVEFAGRHGGRVENVEDERRQIDARLNYQRQLLCGDVEVESDQVLGDLRGGQCPIELSFLLGVQLHVRQPAHRRPLTDLAQFLYMFPHVIQRQFLHGLQLTNFPFKPRQFIPKIPHICCQDMRIETGQKLVDFGEQGITLSLLKHDEACYSIFCYLLSKSSVFGHLEVSIQLLQIHFCLIYPAVAACDTKKPSFQHQQLPPWNAYTATLEQTATFKRILHARPTQEGPQRALSCQGSQQSHLKHKLGHPFIQRLHLPHLSRQKLMGMRDFILDMVDIQMALHPSLLDAHLELPHHCHRVRYLPQLEIHPQPILFQRCPNEDCLGECLITPPQAAHKGVLIIDGLRGQRHSLQLAQLVEHIPRDLGRHQSLTVGHPLPQEVRHFQILSSYQTSHYQNRLQKQEKTSYAGEDWAGFAGACQMAEERARGLMASVDREGRLVFLSLEGARDGRNLGLESTSFSGFFFLGSSSDEELISAKPGFQGYSLSGLQLHLSPTFTRLLNSSSSEERSGYLCCLMRYPMGSFNCLSAYWVGVWGY